MTDAAPSVGSGPNPNMPNMPGMGVGPSMAVGGAVVAVFVGGFGVWAATAPLESAAIAPGVVGVSGERKTVQHLEGGIVADILVADGETVAAGQPLVVLDEPRRGPRWRCSRRRTCRRRRSRRGSRPSGTAGGPSAGPRR